MKHSIRLTGLNGAHVYLSHRGQSAFSPRTARKYLAQWLACNPGGIARIEDRFRDPVENPARLESRALASPLSDRRELMETNETLAASI